MIYKIKKIIEDIFVVSKITQTKNKKIKIFLSVLLSQLIAFSDISIILFFTKIFSPNTLISEKLSILNSFFELEIFLPFLIVFRYYFQYQQTVILKQLENSVQFNLKNYILNQLFENRNFSTSDTFFYLNTLTVHISFFYASISSFFNFLLQSIAFSVYLFLTEPRTITAFLIGILFLIYPIFYLIKKSREFEHSIFENGKEANADIQRILDNVFLIKLLRKEEYEGKRYSKITEKLFDDVLKRHKVQLVNSFLPPFITVFIISIISIFFNSYFQITLPFLGVTLRMFQSLASLSNSTNQIVNSHIHLKTFYDLEMMKSASLRKNYKISEKTNNKNMFELNDVKFSYLKGEIEIFNNVNLNIKKGSHTVVTGPNGSGKSTLLGLLAGVYYPNEGEVITYSQNLGFVGPNPLIFSGTIRENLLYGNNKNVSDNEIIEAIKKFDLFGLDIEIDLNKSISNKQLSSGQMQKIAFIRVYLSDVEVLLLDESTSNLDSNSMKTIFELLNNKNLTIVNSTHDMHKFENISEHYRIEISKSSRVIKKVY